MKPILILSAIPEEIQDFLTHFTETQTQTHGPFTTHHTHHNQHPLILSTTGVGKVSAAMTTQHLIERHQPRAILFTGLAGALNPNYQIGDLVIATHTIQYDIDASELGFPPGTIPYTPYHTFTPDPHLLTHAQAITLPQTIHHGTILTGDQFITHQKRPAYQHLFDHFQGDAIEMEGAALAHVCTHNQIPHLLIRTISDKADATAPNDFTTFLHTASQNSFQLIQHLLHPLTRGS
jgi:5'-methylthioadenosine/S-adenosylhomocysteine nucleosidase